MKRFIFLVAIVMAIFVAIPKEALASSYQPNYTELDTMNNRMDFIDAKWGQSGYTMSSYPYRVYIDYKYEALNETLGIISSKPIVFNANTLQFESEGGIAIRKYKHGSVASVENVSMFVLLDTFTNVQIHSNNTVMFKGENRSFFPLPPLPTPTPTLGEITGEAMTKNTPMSQIIYLLPLLISLVVSFLALRKLLQLLRTVLSKA